METFRVLLVDDEEELVSTIEERLQLRGIHAHAVTSGAKAVQFLETHDFDVIVVDVKMPGMDGLELLRRIKEIRPQAQVILLSGRGSEKESEAGMKEGAADYLIKPIDLDDLVDKMKRAINRE
jgi:DNA-binding response OmpR family regulator